jgi:hypothetical protein
MGEPIVDSLSSVAVETALNNITVTLTDVSKYTVGNYIAIFAQFFVYVGYILEKNGNVLTLDTPINGVFPVGSVTETALTDMNVDGSSIPRIFTIRGGDAQVPGLEIALHRLIFTCYTDGAIDLNKFGDIAEGLTNGIVLRQSNNITTNILNVKDNGELAGFCYNFTPYVATNPAQGQNGFLARLTFASAEKMGTSIILKDGETLDLIIQDDLTSLVKFRVAAEGYFRPIFRTT